MSVQDVDDRQPQVMLEMSMNGKFIRITVGDQRSVMTIGEWSHLIQRPGSFYWNPRVPMVPPDPADVQEPCA